MGGLIFGFAAGTIRANQGGTFGGGFWWGFLLGLIGLIVVAVTKPTPASAQALPAGPPAATPAAPAPAGPAGAVANPRAMRECPHCKEGMRRDASVCPHCRRDSEVRRYLEGRWWSPLGTDPPVWYDERTGRWCDVADLPAPKPDSYDVVVLALTDDGGTAKVARIVADESTDPPEQVRAKLDHLPAVVLRGRVRDGGGRPRRDRRHRRHRGDAAARGASRRPSTTGLAGVGRRHAETGARTAPARCSVY